jgi:signal transduction histidine kinase
MGAAAAGWRRFADFFTRSENDSDSHGPIMSQYAYALIGLTAIVAALVGLLTFAALRFIAAMRDMKGQLREGRDERLFMAAALEDALARLKAQERAMTERAEASERLAADIVSSLTSGLLVVGLDGRLRMLNPAGRRLLGLAADVRVDDLDALAPGAPALVALIREALATGASSARQVLRMPGGEPAATHFGVTVSPLSSGEGGTQGAIALFTDLTAVMALEEQLRVKDGLARLGELTAGLAHEFRNGLATVHGYGRLMQPERLPSDYRPYLEGIRGEVAALEEVVSRFLSFAGPVPLTLAPVDLRALAERVAGELGHAASQAGGRIRVEGEFATLDADEVLLRQALLNLLQNALQACAGAGTPPDVVIEGQVDPLRGGARVAVSDNGPGVAPHLRERIFQPFVTLSGHGTGLGLALVQKIVVSHGGRVVAGAAASGGARFQIDFPLPAALV